MMRQIVVRVSKRVFVGLPYCEIIDVRTITQMTYFLLGRNEEYLKVAVNVTLDIGEGRKFIPLVPAFLKTSVSLFLYHYLLWADA